MTVEIKGRSAFPAEQLERNEQYSQSLGLPWIDSFRGSGSLAIVGGGPSINQYRYTLQSWQGTVWAVNRAWKWCRDSDIDATFFSYDAHPSVAGMADAAERAILGNRCDPAVFNKMSGKPVWLGEGNVGGTTSAGAALIAGLKCGFERITLFGCEGSYQPGATHAYGHWEPEDELVIWCGNMHFITNPQMYMAAIDLSTFIKSRRDLLKEQSGGLLRAMCENDDHEIVGWTQSFKDKIQAA